MGYRDRSTSDEVLLLTNLCRHHEQTIAEMFAIQEPILRYARAMHFFINVMEDDPSMIDYIERVMSDYERHKDYIIDWEDV